MSARRLLVLAAFAATITACHALPERVALSTETAVRPARYGYLADVAGRIDGLLGSGESAQWLLDGSELAFDARLALVDEAAVSLDVQYFIWQTDATGHLLASRLLAAADRGVKVRLLVDDFGVSSERGDVLRLDAHPGIEVRTFNPWAHRRSRLGTGLEYAARIRTLNRRMHNKTLTADGRFSILGGRNIGDRYFGVYEPFVQDDLDVLVAGPVVASITTTFDEFWNSDSVYPVSWFAYDERPHHPLEMTRQELADTLETQADRLASFAEPEPNWNGYLGSLADNFAAGQARVLWDTPERSDSEQDRLYPEFKAFVASARREVLISSPYLIPDREFRELLRTLVARGVRVAIVTNSLASNNHVVAHTGYRRWRRELLGAGVELYELKPDAATVSEYVTPPVMPGRLGLHTKAVVVDDTRSFVGSPNVDPRSMELNTEIGLVTEGAAPALAVKALIERDMAPENAWRVTMDDEGWLEWSSGEETLRRQPAKGFRQRAVEFLLNLLPIKNQA